MASPEEHCQDCQQALDNDEDQDDDAVAIGPGVRFRTCCDQSKEAEEENNCTWLMVLVEMTNEVMKSIFCLYTCHDGTDCDIAQLISLPDIKPLQTVDDGPAQEETACSEELDEEAYWTGSATYPTTSRRMTAEKGVV